MDATRALRALGLAVLLPAAVMAADPLPPFTDDTVLELTLRAPLGDLFSKGTADEKYSVPAIVEYRQPPGGEAATLPGVELSLRGHTSKRETECPFPKLKLKFRDGSVPAGSVFAGHASLRIGTHCGESPDEALTSEFGRLANEKSPQREGFVYRLLDVLDIPTLKVRPARITYIDTGAATEPVTRAALLLEDDAAAIARLGGRSEIPAERFSSARDHFDPKDTARLAFAQALIGNFDWCLRFYRGDRYRCNARLPIWNVLAFDRPEATALPLMADFDLAGIVVGRHHWFGKVYGNGFLPGASPIELEVLSQVQRTRSHFPREILDEARAHFLSKKEAAYDVLSVSGLDPAGKELARQHLDAFFAALPDAAFYRPVIVRPDTLVFADSAKTRQACNPGQAIPAGTPVNVVNSEEDMAEVGLLDVHWRWAPPRNCPGVRNGTVWVERQAIDAEYPAGATAATTR